MKAYFQAPTNEQFDASYGKNNTKTSGGGASSIRKVVTEERKTVYIPPPTNKSSTGRTKQTTDEVFNETYSKPGIVPTYLRINKRGKNEDNLPTNKSNSLKLNRKNSFIIYKTVEDFKRGEINFDNTLDQLDPYDDLNLEQEAKKIRAIVTALKGYLLFRAYKRVTRANLSIWSCGIWLWSTVHLPMAFLSLIGLGIAYTYYEIKDFANGLSESQNVFVSAVGHSVDFVGGVAGGVATFINDSLHYIGLDLSFIQSLVKPEILFIVPYVVLLGLAIIFLFFIYLYYKILFLNPLDGQWAGLKMGMFLMTLIGYSLPLLNLLPWFMLWTGAVWIKPK